MSPDASMHHADASMIQDGGGGGASSVLDETAVCSSYGDPTQVRNCIALVTAFLYYESPPRAAGGALEWPSIQNDKT